MLLQRCAERNQYLLKISLGDAMVQWAISSLKSFSLCVTSAEEVSHWTVVQYGGNDQESNFYGDVFWAKFVIICFQNSQGFQGSENFTKHSRFGFKKMPVESTVLTLFHWMILGLICWSMRIWKCMIFYSLEPFVASRLLVRAFIFSLTKHDCIR